MSEVQLEGVILLGGTDYSDFISSLVIRRERKLITRPATFGDAQESQKAGSRTESVTINFVSSMAASSVWAELYDAIDTDSAELTFSARMSDAAIGVDNPQFAGTMVVSALDTGGTAGELRTGSVTCPVTAAGVTKTTS